MGLFGAIRSVCSSAKSAVCSAFSAAKDAAGGIIDKGKEIVHKAGEKIKEVTKPVREVMTGIVAGAKNLIDKVTGKDKVKEAEELLKEITKKYEIKEIWFRNEVDKYVNSINCHVNKINEAKKLIKTELFIQMADNMRKIKDVNIDPSFKIESFSQNEYKFDSVRGKKDLFLINFDKYVIENTVLAIVTFGIATRKKAKETLMRVEEEEAKVNAEIAKMETEIQRLKAIDMSLANVEKYFADLIEIYKQLLVRLENNVKYLQLRCLAFAYKIIQSEMSVRRLPVAQVKEIEAVVTASMILKSMVEKQIVSIEDKNEMAQYAKTMETQQQEIVQVFKAA